MPHHHKGSRSKCEVRDIFSDESQDKIVLTAMPKTPLDLVHREDFLEN